MMSCVPEEYEDWKSQLVTSPDIMGGTTVFPNSRVTVKRIAGLVIRGISLKEIQEDYPMVSRQDVKFARKFVDEEVSE